MPMIFFCFFPKKLHSDHESKLQIFNPGILDLKIGQTWDIPIILFSTPKQNPADKQVHASETPATQNSSGLHVLFAAGSIPAIKFIFNKYK